MSRIKKITFGQYFVDFGKQGLVYDANEDFFNISGYTKQDLENGEINFFNLIPEEDKAPYLDLVEKESGYVDPILIRHPFRRKNGSAVYVLCLGNPIENNCFQITITDYTEHMNLQQQYDNSLTELDTLMANVPGGVAVVRVDENDLYILKSNDEFYNQFELKENDVYMRSCVKEKDLEVLCTKIHYSCQKGVSLFCELHFELTDNVSKWFRFYGNLYKYKDGKPLFYLLVFDITNEKNLANELSMQAEKFKILAQNSEEVYIDYDVANDVMVMIGSQDSPLNGERRMEEHLKARNFVRKHIHAEDYEEFQNMFETLISDSNCVTAEFRSDYLGGEYTWLRVMCVSITDASEQVARIFGRISFIANEKQMKNKIHSDNQYITYLLETDNISGLYKRKAFIKKAAAAIKELNDDYVYAFVYSDINDFSYVNDNFGFEAGNDMLADFGKIIQKTDVLLYASRIYSDYFVGLYKAESREALTSAIKKRNDIFYEMQKRKYPASNMQISCGIYFVTDTKIDINIAIDNANLARRSIKSIKDVQIGLYARRMRTQKIHEQAIANEIHSAILNRNIEMFLQPKFSMSTMEIIGAEALARWRNPDGTYKMPYEFIPVLEKVGYIDELDFLIYEEVLRTLESWKKRGCKLIPISVNFSRYHVSKSDFVDKVIELADKYDVDKSNIEIEITESCFEEDTQTLFAYMQRLRNQGFKVDMDDFGIGYSTLSILLKAPIDIVKIDKSFIDNLETSEIDRDYLKSICKLIDLVDKDIIFEGVESTGQAKILVDSGYNKAQGWLFDKARPLDEFNQRYMGIE